MAVTFSSKWSINPETFGVNFEAFQGTDRIICNVSQEALQDIQPSNALAKPQEQFFANQMAFQAIAEQLILAGDYKDGVLNIFSRHVRA
jgi:hypothetical protein